MDAKPSKRPRLRFFPEDEAVSALLEKTAHHSLSNVIRGARILLEHVCSGSRNGFQILFQNAATGETVDAFEREKKRKGRRSRTEKSIEIRVTFAAKEESTISAGNARFVLNELTGAVSNKGDLDHA